MNETKVSQTMSPRSSSDETNSSSSGAPARGHPLSLAHTPSAVRTISALMGSECIYRERGQILIVRIAGVRFDSSGVEFIMERVTAPGFENLPKEKLGLTANYRDLEIGVNYLLNCGHVSWFLIPDPIVVSHMKRYMQGSGVNVGDPIEEINRFLQ